jgi:hypothetical protein
VRMLATAVAEAHPAAAVAAASALLQVVLRMHCVAAYCRHCCEPPHYALLHQLLHQQTQRDACC